MVSLGLQAHTHYSYIHCTFLNTTPISWAVYFHRLMKWLLFFRISVFLILYNFTLEMISLGLYNHTHYSYIHCTFLNTTPISWAVYFHRLMKWLLFFRISVFLILYNFTLEMISLGMEAHTHYSYIHCTFLNTTPLSWAVYFHRLMKLSSFTILVAEGSAIHCCIIERQTLQSALCFPFMYSPT